MTLGRGQLQGNFDGKVNGSRKLRGQRQRQDQLQPRTTRTDADKRGDCNGNSIL
jgi:hypothetical protein